MGYLKCAVSVGSALRVQPSNGEITTLIGVQLANRYIDVGRGMITKLGDYGSMPGGNRNWFVARFNDPPDNGG